MIYLPSTFKSRGITVPTRILALLPKMLFPRTRRANDQLCQILRSVPRGLAPGPSGLRTDHIIQLRNYKNLMKMACKLVFLQHARGRSLWTVMCSSRWTSAMHTTPFPGMPAAKWPTPSTATWPRGQGGAYPHPRWLHATVKACGAPPAFSKASLCHPYCSAPG